MIGAHLLISGFQQQLVMAYSGLMFMGRFLSGTLLPELDIEKLKQ